MDRTNPNNKIVEMSKKLQNKRKANLVKRGFNNYSGQKSSNNLFNTLKHGEKKLYSRLFSVNPKVNNVNRRRFSIGNK